MTCFWVVPLLILMGCGDDSPASDAPSGKDALIEISPTDLQINAAGEVRTIIVKSATAWTVDTDGQNWYSLSANSGYSGEAAVKITALKNTIEKERTAVLTFSAGKDYKKEYTFKQAEGEVENYVPQGYSLVWQDEFNDARLADGKPALPKTSDWWYETGSHGWGNHEIQNYIAGFSGTDTCAVVSDGILKIIAKKKGNEVLSTRINTKQNWTYGY